MRSGNINVHIRRGFLNQILDPDQSPYETYCAASITNCGAKLYTESLNVTDNDNLVWDEDLQFSLGPASDLLSFQRILNIYLYQKPQTGAAEEEQDESKYLKGMGTISLFGLEEEQEPLHTSIPLVDFVGKNVGTISAVVAYFYSRTPGKGRDELGRDIIQNPELLRKGGEDAAQEINATSPKHMPHRRHLV